MKTENIKIITGNYQITQERIIGKFTTTSRKIYTISRKTTTNSRIITTISRITTTSWKITKISRKINTTSQKITVNMHFLSEKYHKCPFFVGKLPFGQTKILVLFYVRQTDHLQIDALTGHYIENCHRTCARSWY